MSGGKLETRAKGGNALGGAGGFGFGRDADNGPVGRAYGGGGGDGRYRNYGGRLVKWGGYCRNHKLRDRS